jgi:hypothetical protein
MHPALIPDEQLLKDCQVEAYRASGPGGQKRNKTSSAVRITHRPTGLHAVGTESRQQSRNKELALRRVRHALALAVRSPAPSPTGRLGPSPKSAQYLPVLIQVFDALDAAGYSISDAAATLGTSTANLVGFLQADEKAMAHVNRQRAQRGLKSLG